MATSCNLRNFDHASKLLYIMYSWSDVTVSETVHWRKSICCREYPLLWVFIAVLSVLFTYCFLVCCWQAKRLGIFTRWVKQLTTLKYLFIVYNFVARLLFFLDTWEYGVNRLQLKWHKASCRFSYIFPFWVQRVKQKPLLRILGRRDFPF